jgi:sarcosine oxidase subunit beta
MTASLIPEPVWSSRTADVVVVGAGIVGLSIAFFLTRLGLSVLVVEKLGTVAALTSARSGGGVRAQWERPHNIAMMRAAIEAYRRFDEIIGLPWFDIGLEQLGYLYATETAEGARRLAARVARQKTAGLDDVELLDQAEVRRRFPTLSPTIAAAAFRAADGWLSVERVVEGYLQASEAEILLGTSVSAIETRGGRAIGLQTSAGPIAAGAVVVATGTEAGALLSRAGVPVPMRLVVGGLAKARLAAALPAGLPAIIDLDRGSFWRPEGSGARITAPPGTPRVVERSTDEPAPEPDYLRRALDGIRPLAPFWSELSNRIVLAECLVGLYPMTPDGAPILGPDPRIKDLFHNIGYGGHGIMGSIEGSRRVAECIAGFRAHSAADPFAVERFLEPRRLESEPMTVNLLGAGEAWRTSVQLRTETA